MINKMTEPAHTFIKQYSIRFLQLALVLLGMGALAFLLWEPHLEGRNANAGLLQIYFADPFLAFAYIGSIPFFAALYHGLKVLGYASKNNAYSDAALKALRTIRFCAMLLICFVAVGEIIILLNESDDRAGGVFVGILVTFGSLLIAATASFLEQIIRQSAAVKPGG